MFKKIFMLVIIYTLTQIVYASEKNPVSHTHSGRTHTHILPLDKGIHHTHNKGKKEKSVRKKRSIRNFFSNTTSLIDIKSNKHYVYFEESGKFFGYHNGVVDIVGKWYINKKNNLCFNMPENSCLKLVQDNNGIHGWNNNKKILTIVSINKGDTRNMVEKYKINSQNHLKGNWDNSTNAAILGAVILGAFALDSMSGSDSKSCPMGYKWVEFRGCLDTRYY